MFNKKPKEHKNYHEKKGIVHFLLAHSYLVFFLAILVGVSVDPIVNIKIFSNPLYKNIGLLFLAFSSIIIYWAQSSSHNYHEKKKKDDNKSKFEFGPYKYLRHPTHFGLFIMALGFGLLINSFFSVVLTALAYISTKLFFIKTEEKILEKKYGQSYIDYKKKVRNWI